MRHLGETRKQEEGTRGSGGQRTAQMRWGAWGVGLSLPGNTRQVFQKRACQDSCLQTLLLEPPPPPPQVGRLSRILSRAPVAPVAIRSFPPSLPGSPAWPHVAAQSPPPTQPRERTAGTEFNRRHQQPPGKPRKVDTLIPVPVSGEQAQGRSLFLLGEGCWGPTPQWARPLPGRCHGDGPYRKQPGSFQKARQLWAPEGMGC